MKNRVITIFVFIFIMTIQIVYGQNPNLSFNKPVTVSSVESGNVENFDGKFAVDDDLGTRWASVYSDPQWIMVDLESPQTIRCILLDWEAAYAKEYEIQISDDATTWTTLFSETSGDGDLDMIVVDPVEARYVRMYGTKRASAYGYSLWELGVYPQPVDLGEDVPTISLSIFEKDVNSVTETQNAAPYGMSLIDTDLDGWLDLFSVQYATEEILFRNIGDGQLERLSNSLTDIVTPAASSGIAWGDYDNDGDPDFYIADQGGGNVLFRNDGDNHFVRIQEGEIVTDNGNSFDATWLDYDLDGWLDLVVSNVAVMGIGVGTTNPVYHNNGDGTFNRMTDLGVASDLSNNTSTSWTDIDNDGDLDCYIPDFGLKDKLYLNNGDGSFTQDTESPVVEKKWISISGVFGDYDNDQDMDLFVATGYPSAQPDLLYQNNGDGTFTRVTEGSIVTTRTPSWNASWGDMDNDGDLDIYLTTLPGDNILYMNQGDGTFIRVVDDISVSEDYTSCAALWGDMDHDGDMDLLVNDVSNSQTHVYINKGNSNHWIEIACEGTVSNRSAFGTRVKVKATINGTPTWQMREITDSNGFRQRYQDEGAHFGLGDATVIDSLIVLWPSGQRLVQTDVAVDQFLILKEEAPEQFLRVGFRANHVKGFGKLDVQFMPTCQTSEEYPIVSWAWDLDGDGIIDSNDENPEFTYQVDAAATYSVSLTVSNGVAEQTSVVPDFITMLGYVSVIQFDNSRLDMGEVSGSTDTSFTLYNLGAGSDTITIDIPSRYASNVMAEPATFVIAGYDTQEVVIHVNPEGMNTNRNANLNIMVRSVNNTGSNAQVKQLFFKPTASSAAKSMNAIPQTYVLEQNYPNPFNPETKIQYALPNQTHVSLAVFDTIGRKLKEMVHEVQPAGTYSVLFSSEELPSGIYYYRLQAANFNQIRKMLVVK